jgi:hypothetical protein
MLKLENYSGLIDEPQLSSILSKDRQAHTINTLQIMYETTEQIENLLKDIKRVDDFSLRVLYRMKEFIRRVQCLSHQILNLYFILKNHYHKFDVDMPPLKIGREDTYLTELQPEDIERLNEPKLVEELHSPDDDDDQRVKMTRSVRGLSLYTIESSVPNNREKKKANVFTRKNTIVKKNGVKAMQTLINSIEDPINKLVFKDIFYGVEYSYSESLHAAHGQR